MCLLHTLFTLPKLIDDFFLMGVFDYVTTIGKCPFLEARICTCSGMWPAIDFQCGFSAAVAGCDMNTVTSNKFRFNIF